ncbi:MAG: hypothetical protein GY913_26555 [Proteobacteria bacterium]|nr:hypothetical protein [Pseudomonadota bacterium]MCP4920479.1 hypothetical protein [Pseudomonadota bacterium]
MTTALALLAVAAAAFLLFHFVVKWLQGRFLFTTGSEYMLLGVLVGPAALDLIDAETVRQLSPLMSLAIGWVGLLYGASLSPRRLLSEESRGAVMLSIFGSIGTFGVVFGATWLGLGLPWVPQVETAERMLAALALGCAAMATSPAVLELVKSRFSAEGDTTRTLTQAVRVDEFVAIAAFGALFCWFRDPSPNPWRDTPITHPEWYGVSILLGILLGGLFRFFLRSEEDADRQFLSLVGIIVFASGAAHYLELSPLLVNLVLGFVMLFNARDASSKALLDVLEKSRGPMYIVLLIFAGATWQAEPVLLLLFAVLYAFVRGGARLASGWFSALAAGSSIRRDVGRGMLGQGEVAVAMALNLAIVYPHEPLMGVVMTCILASVLVNEVWSARLLKGLLIDAGDIRAEIPGDSAGDLGPADITPAEGS